MGRRGLHKTWASFQESAFSSRGKQVKMFHISSDSRSWIKNLFSEYKDAKATKNNFLKINKREKQAKTSDLHSSSAESVLLGWKEDPMCQTRIDRLLLIRPELEQWWIRRSIHNKRVSAHHQNCGCPCGWDYQPVSRLAWAEWCATHAAVGQGPEMAVQKVVGHSRQTAQHSEHV